MYGPLAHASELQVIAHPLAELSVKKGRIGPWLIVVDHGEVLVEQERNNKQRCPRPSDPPLIDLLK